MDHFHDVATLHDHSAKVAFASTVPWALTSRAERMRLPESFIAAVHEPYPLASVNLPTLSTCPLAKVTSHHTRPESSPASTSMIIHEGLPDEIETCPTTSPSEIRRPDSGRDVADGGFVPAWLVTMASTPIPSTATSTAAIA